MDQCCIPVTIDVPQPARLSRLGRWMARHRSGITGVQWAIVIVYALLVVLPAFADLPPEEAHLYDNLVLFAQFVFWGIWWPFVILSVMLLGRVWCGVFCPEGALSEWASRYGLGRPVPRWMKWGGWPVIAFVLTTLYGQMVSVYGYAKPALLILGGSTLAAVAVGLLYGRGRRVWCRHLCPVSGVFALLARLAPVHFRVDRAQWDRGARRAEPPVECAPLIDVRRMTGAAPCHMCGRCGGYRGAVELASRPPGAEVTRMSLAEERPWEVRLLVFGMLGIAVGAFQWSASPWLVQAKQVAAAWLVEHDQLTLLDDHIPWWLLTHFPQVNDLFSWLDGLLLLGYVGTFGLLVGGWISAWLRFAGALLPGDGAREARRLAYCLIPMAGIGIFLGLSALTVTLLRGEGILVPHLDGIRAALLMLAVLWSLALAWRQLARGGASGVRRVFATSGVALALAGCVVPWVLLFYVW